MAKVKTEAEWQAEMDAQTLADAEVIKQTPTRMKKAKTAAKKQAVEQEKKARGMRKIATSKVPRRKK